MALFGPKSTTELQLEDLENHLQHENPILLEVVQSFRRLDRVARKLGLIEHDGSYATRVPWWPLISLLGTFSAGKSTFINHFLQYNVQDTGTQAVDDKFTVMSFSTENEVRVLPGLALDADPRFPFYRISKAIDEVAAGEGRRMSAYLQLKTCPCETLRGKILIDSPGFDADEQRNSTLRITDHIIDLSDLVLVFFDARHPEPGAMHDTLEHLVADTIQRPDSSKFLYILNQIDTTAREDNPEEVIAAWQRSLAQKGLTAGKFFRIYNPDAAVDIKDENTRRRFEKKRDADLADIHTRMRQVETERAYRIISVLEQTAKTIECDRIPRLRGLLARWKWRVFAIDVTAFGLGALALFKLAGILDGTRFSAVMADPVFLAMFWTGLGIIGLYLHFSIRQLVSRIIGRSLINEDKENNENRELARALKFNTRPWRPLLSRQPRGWGRSARSAIRRVQDEAHRYVQTLNDQFTDPSRDDATTPVSGQISPSIGDGTP